MSEFEMGDQAKSLKRIFAQGVVTATTKVEVDGHEIVVYVIAGSNFPFEEYKYLQVLVNEDRHSPEPTYLKQVIRTRYEIPGNDDWDNSHKVNAWFDFPNEVLWVLSETDRDQLISALEAIQQKWAQKNA